MDNTTGKPSPSQPLGGARFTTYSLKEHLKKDEFAENWSAFFGREDRNKQLVSNPRRSQRQNGMILEADKFRKFQGAFLKTRLYSIENADRPGSGLKWWFANSDRITLHHLVMMNYYLDHKPTDEDEIKDRLRCTSRTVRTILRTAVEIGSLEAVPLEKDSRRKTYYPTRGLCSDTDNFFGSDEVGAEGLLFYLSELLTELFGEGRYPITQYLEDVKEFHRLIATLMERSKSR
tara:strand:+ start:926 stop:1624 length:699 start_codon:yes stop_codon:yes gene_type:complete